MPHLHSTRNSHPALPWFPTDTPHSRQQPPACFPPPSGTDSRERAFRRRRAKPHGTATSQTDFVTRCATHHIHPASHTLPHHRQILHGEITDGLRPLSQQMQERETNIRSGPSTKCMFMTVGVRNRSLLERANSHKESPCEISQVLPSSHGQRSSPCSQSRSCAKMASIEAFSKAFTQPKLDQSLWLLS